MSFLEELKQLAKEMFDKAENKADVDNLSKLNSLVEQAETEHNSILTEKAELLKDYKDLQKSIQGSIKSDKVEQVTGLTLEETLQKYAIKED